MSDQTSPPKPPDAAPAFEAELSELVSLGMRGARVVTRMMEIEHQAAEIVAASLPEAAAIPGSLGEALAGGQGVDTAVAAMAEAVPRVEVLARSLDRLSRAVRRSVALMQRMQAGWPRAAADDRQAMVRRQVARGVAEVIRRESSGEAAERLFDDLAERLENPALETEIGVLPVQDVVRRICRDLGLAAEPGVQRANVLWRGAGQSPVLDTG
jgi:hypothetical protein